MTVSDPLPASATFVSVASDKMSCGGTLVVTCTRGQLLAGETAVATIVVRLTSPGTLVNTASVTSDTADPSAANQVSTATTNAISVVSSRRPRRGRRARRASLVARS